MCRNPLILFSVCICLWLNGVFARAQSVNPARDLVVEVENGLDEKYRNPGSVIEMTDTLKKIPAFLKLRETLKGSWRECLPQLSIIAPTETSEVIFYKAAQVLPKEEYIALLTQSIPLVEQKKVSYQQFKWALFPSEKHLRNMWNEDADDPYMKRLAYRAKTLTADDQAVNSCMDRVIAGNIEKPSFGETGEVSGFNARLVVFMVVIVISGVVLFRLGPRKTSYNDPSLRNK